MKNSEKSTKIKVAVIGARGYSGQELSRLLLEHPQVDFVTVIYNENKAFSLWEQFPELRRLGEKLGKREPSSYSLTSFLNSSMEVSVVFLATPNEVSLELAGKFLERGLSVIDLSGIFRLNQGDSKISQSVYLKYYGLDHTEPQLLSQAVFGLHPFHTTEIQKLNSKKPFLIANPGCYVTSVLMAAIPLLKSGLVEPKSLIVDAKSGASGAGKKMNENLLFSELYGDFYPYKVLNHQHVPEMEMYLDKLADVKSKIVFTPHLLPVFRGILSTCYFKWSESAMRSSLEERQNKVKSAYASAYESYKLVEVGPLAEKKKLVTIKAISGSCMTNIGYDLDDQNLIVFSAIDNLLKGAASQAVENLNCVFGLPLHEGLL